MVIVFFYFIHDSALINYGIKNEDHRQFIPNQIKKQNSIINLFLGHKNLIFFMKFLLLQSGSNKIDTEINLFDFQRW